ncbi:accessory Sec system protein translocase subunit SecY2 [Ligilactobacillus salivarius]|uniref:Accessory Sec system protein translocase subunit SecY2 n=1 Tax=Ligilactobacillus salivarius TaxID=1624 RepID=A0ABD7YU27_9LACO|nr:accessory Sec system protein translocase subunit SecY2 [Ligilactobacillus salivarius]WHS05932.1 accessory Sec system protein translocase subunit SecY2 [Ligilactobacillus salivarius]WHS07987.1 accessory Sec system protein translocase subunit SecY2 [Ligilactobacillus salivarius]WHS09845.1 accessory Sec system protein translocase subunit SecY2 [Ligilactobacillus salivarius]WHS13786.1 accessory Sec system protein translocase subunit SecY2 [Ligilactobacillus salivarius]WHS17600.1 accessory Sec s
MRVKKRKKKDTLFTFFAPKFMTTACILTIYILGSSIPIPLGDTVAEAKSNYIMQLASSATGGNLTNLTLMSMGLGPYMIVMILWSVLAMIKPLGLGNLSEKESGYVKNLMILIIAIIQAIGIVMNFNLKLDFMHKSSVICILLAGGLLTVYLSSVNSSKGVGGMMLIMLFGIISNIGKQAGLAFKMISKKPNAVLITSIIILAILLLIVLSVQMERSEYRIPVTQILINNDLNKESYIPIKPNASGGMAIMFAMSFFMIIAYILQILAKHYPVSWLKGFERGVTMFSMPGATIYVGSLLLLSIVFGFVNIDAGKIAESLRNSGDYIKGIRPGRDTKRYINKYVWFFSIFGASYVSLIAGGPLYLGILFPEYKRIVMLPGMALMCVGMIFTTQDQVRAGKSLYSYKKWIK